MATERRTLSFTGSERECDGPATVTQLSSPPVPRGTDVEHGYPLGPGRSGRGELGRFRTGCAGSGLSAKLGWSWRTTGRRYWDFRDIRSISMRSPKRTNAH